MMKRLNLQCKFRKEIPIILLLLTLLFTTSCKLTGNVPDPYYKPVVESPAYDVPTILVDASHQNFHQITGRFTGFARLARADGFRVQEIIKPFPDDCFSNLSSGGCEYWEQLKKADILVLPHLNTTISDDEATLLATWVYMFGGSLFVLTDHPPYDATVLPLLKKLNLTTVNLYPVSPTIDQRSSWDTAHPILLGRSTNEQIYALDGNGSIGVVIKLDTQTPYESFPPIPNLIIPYEEDGGLLATIEWGSGRVVVLGDGALTTEQTLAAIGFDPISGPIADSLFSTCESAQSSNECMILLAERVCALDNIPAEQCDSDDLLHVPGLTSADNQQFILNILRWLSRIL